MGIISDWIDDRIQRAINTNCSSTHNDVGKIWSALRVTREELEEVRNTVGNRTKQYDSIENLQKSLSLLQNRVNSLAALQQELSEYATQVQGFAAQLNAVGESLEVVLQFQREVQGQNQEPTEAACEPEQPKPRGRRRNRK